MVFAAAARLAGKKMIGERLFDNLFLPAPTIPNATHAEGYQLARKGREVITAYEDRQSESTVLNIPVTAWINSDDDASCPHAGHYASRLMGSTKSEIGLGGHKTLSKTLRKICDKIQTEPDPFATEAITDPVAAMA